MPFSTNPETGNLYYSPPTPKNRRRVGTGQTTSPAYTYLAEVGWGYVYLARIADEGDPEYSFEELELWGATTAGITKPASRDLMRIISDDSHGWWRITDRRPSSDFEDLGPDPRP